MDGVQIAVAMAHGPFEQAAIDLLA